MTRRRGSAKTAVVEYLFDARYDYATRQLGNPLVSLEEVQEAIELFKAQGRDTGLSTRNPANFFKDLTRVKAVNANWPSKVAEAGYTGEDAIESGAGACFRFVPIPPGQTAPFKLIAPSPSLLAGRTRLQSLSLALPARQLGGGGESWIAQVVAQLRVVEAHFAAFSPTRAVELVFLQTNRKLSGGEVDAIWRMVDEDGAHWLVAVEVKGCREEIVEAQVLRSARALLAGLHEAPIAVGVIPLAVKALDEAGKTTLHTVEWEAARLDEPAKSHRIVAEGIFELVPPVPNV